MAESLASLLECPICKDPFTDPRMLTSCFHTLCCKCLLDYIDHSQKDGQFDCPVCRKPMQVPFDRENAFPKNFFINKCLDVVVTDARTGAVSKTEQHGLQSNFCSNADDGDDCTQPEQFCLDCCEYYCKNCSRVHRKTKATRNHVQVVVDDLTDDVLRDAMTKSETPRCLKHADEKLKLYCSTCECAVCSVCCHISHKNHDFQEMTDVDAALKLKLAEMVKQFQAMIDAANDRRAKIKDSRGRTETNVSAAQASSDTILKTVRQMMEKKGKQNNQNISKINESDENRAGTQTKNLTLHAQLLESVQTFTQDLLKRGTVFNRVASVPEVRNRLKDFQVSAQDATDGSTHEDIPPNSVDLVVKHFDGLVLKQEIKLRGSDSQPGPTLEIQVMCGIKQDKKYTGKKSDQTKAVPGNAGGPRAVGLPKPRLSVTVINWSGVYSGLVFISDMVTSLANDLDCTVTETQSKVFQPVPTDQPHVDVICCWKDEMQSLKDTLPKKTASKRRLVLLHWSEDSSVAKTRGSLGECRHLFDRVIQYDDNTYPGAKDSLADYFMRASNPAAVKE